MYEAFPMAHVDHKSGNYREEGQLSGEDLGLIRKLTRADRKVAAEAYLDTGRTSKWIAVR